MDAEELPSQPSLAWRVGSSFTTGAVGILCRTFLLGFNRLEVNGWERFDEILQERRDVEGRTRGLVTVCNHLSVLDDPIIWGALPYLYHFNANNVRWSLASHDITFQRRATSFFFTLGNTLPAHRSAHSPFGGLFQPTMTQAIRLLSDGPFSAPISHPSPSPSLSAPDLSDPFSSGILTYTTNNIDSFPAPSAYASRRHAWVHVFPEGKIHQKADLTMRYFKWGVSRLILEAEPCPDVVPIWIEGLDQVMNENRQWPRFIPRAGKNLSVTFGERVDTEARFGDLRDRWRRLVERVRKDAEARGEDVGDDELGIIRNQELRYGEEAVKLREECTLRVRHEVLKLREQRGWSAEDPKWSLVDTWKQEGSQGKKEGQMDDGSLVKDQ